MSRTKGSGWGAGPMLYQLCICCGKKKAVYDIIPMAEWHKPFRCLSCKERFDSDILVRKKYSHGPTL